MESGKIDQYCVDEKLAAEADANNQDYNPCETCTWQLMNKRIGDMFADACDEAYERARDEGYWDSQGVYHKYKDLKPWFARTVAPTLTQPNLSWNVLSLK